MAENVNGAQQSSGPAELTSKIDVGAALAKKLTEKPQTLEHLLSIIDRLDTLDEFSAILQAQKESVTDAMIERMAGTAEKLAELTELALNYNLKPLLDTGESFINSGTLNDLAELANAVASAKRMMTDGLIERAVGTGLDIVEAFLTVFDIKELVKTLDRSTYETLNESNDEKYHKGGIFSLFSLIKDQDVMFGLKFMMLLAKNLTKNLRENQQSIFISSSFGKED